jgi:hypothetical protein
LPRCSALTVRGKPCRNTAVAGGDRCSVHRDRLEAAAVDQVLAMLRAGNYVEVAARAAGVPAAVLLRELQEEIDRASAEGEARSVTRIAQAASDSWQAAAWLLERSAPERWARPAQRADEKPPVSVARTDSLDELAGRRVQRRAGW